MVETRTHTPKVRAIIAKLERGDADEEADAYGTPISSEVRHHLGWVPV